MSSFCPDQVLLSENFHLRPGCRQKSLLRNSGVGGGGPGGLNLILSEGVWGHRARVCQGAPLELLKPLTGIGTETLSRERETIHLVLVWQY